MRKLLLTALLLLTCFMFASCRTDVPSGFVGVKVYLVGGDKGVDTEILHTGRYYIGYNEKLYLFPTYKITKVWTADKNEDNPGNEEMTFQTKEGLQVSADVGIIFSVEPSKANLLFQEFHQGIEEITHVYMRSRVRDGLNRIGSQYAVEDIYGPKKAEIIDRVSTLIVPDLREKGLIVDKLYFVNAIRLPEVVQKAVDDKISATQKSQQRENEVAEARANAEKKIAEARGDAESLRLKAQTLTGQNLEWEKLQVQRIAAEKWNGVLPTTMVPGQSLPFINVGQHQ